MKAAFTGPDLCAMSARDVVALLHKREVSSADLIDAAVARMARTGPAINATVTLCEDRARARAADTTGPLAGLPILIKDLTPVEGVRTTWGTPAFADHVPDASHPLVTRLENRGAVVLGKSNTPEMGAGANTFNAVFGPTRNPWDTRMNAGGSSGGAAAALATGEIWLAHGSDLGGSLRTPASYCGIVGLRPSPGVAGGGPDSQAFDMMPVQGPMARDVADCALFLDAMAGFDPAAPISYPAPETSYLDQCLTDPGEIRIAFSMLSDYAPATQAMETLLRSALSKLDRPGLEIEDAAPNLTGADEAFRALRALCFWGDARSMPDSVTRHFKATLKQNIEEGRALSVDEVADANLARTALYREMTTLLSRYDVLACPQTGLFPLPWEHEFPPEVAGHTSRDYLDWLRFAFPATLCGLPALCLPVGFTNDGMPIGIQLIGRPRGEGRLLSIARALEETLSLGHVPIDPIVRHEG